MCRMRNAVARARATTVRSDGQPSFQANQIPRSGVSPMRFLFPFLIAVVIAGCGPSGGAGKDGKGGPKIGRASCRERGEDSVGAVSLKKKGRERGGRG